MKGLLVIYCFCVLYFSVFYQKTDAEGHAPALSMMELVPLLTYSMLSKRFFFLLFLTLTEKSFKKQKWEHKYISQNIQYFLWDWKRTLRFVLFFFHLYRIHYDSVITEHNSDFFFIFTFDLPYSKIKLFFLIITWNSIP